VTFTIADLSTAINTVSLLTGSRSLEKYYLSESTIFNSYRVTYLVNSITLFNSSTIKRLSIRDYIYYRDSRLLVIRRGIYTIKRILEGE
jgi:hypothetical protein